MLDDIEESQMIETLELISSQDNTHAVCITEIMQEYLGGEEECRAVLSRCVAKGYAKTIGLRHWSLTQKGKEVA